MFFFFQAEDGIRDADVTGVQTCALPILIDQKFLTDEQLWRLAQNVRSLSPPEPPEVRDVIHAPQIVGPTPVSPDVSTWARLARYRFPLAGQVGRNEPWFAPAVTGDWAQ